MIRHRQSHGHRSNTRVTARRPHKSTHSCRQGNQVAQEPGDTYTTLDGELASYDGFRYPSYVGDTSHTGVHNGTGMMEPSPYPCRSLPMASVGGLRIEDNPQAAVYDAFLPEDRSYSPNSSDPYSNTPLLSVGEDSYTDTLAQDIGMSREVHDLSTTASPPWHSGRFAPEDHSLDQTEEQDAGHCHERYRNNSGDSGNSLENHQGSVMQLGEQANPVDARAGAEWQQDFGTGFEGHNIQGFINDHDGPWNVLNAFGGSYMTDPSFGHGDHMN